MLLPRQLNPPLPKFQISQRRQRDKKGNLAVSGSINILFLAQAK